MPLLIWSWSFKYFFGLGKASRKDPLCFDDQLLLRGEIKMQEENERHNKHRETLWFMVAMMQMVDILSYKLLIK
jgi:hypothetical protein